MGRSRAHVRRSAHTYPSGTLAVYADGYGFVRTSEGEFFIPQKKMNGAYDGDLVEVSPLPIKERDKKYCNDTLQWVSGKESPAARVVRVINRAHETVVGRYEIAEPFGVVIPLDYHLRHDIFTLLKDNPNIPEGALVRVRITTYPTGRNAATGVIEEVLGEAEKQNFVVDALIERNNLETAFSDQALSEAAAACVDEHDALVHGYRDIRDRVVFTVDPEDARDFDDAVSLERVGAGAGAAGVVAGTTSATGTAAACAGDADTTSAPAVWRLGVHIADVAHYVSWDSSLDLDARRRATSVYLVDRVLPMLPPALSNDLCSLKPGVVRRCMTVDLYLNEKAEVVSVDIYPALMESRRRMTYSEVQEILDSAGGEEACAPFSSIEQRLFVLDRIAKLRASRRHALGAPEFSQVETKVKLNDQHEPIGVELHQKTPATQLIEEAMLMANHAVAHYLVEQGIPGMFRVHEAPLPMNCAALVPVFEEFPWFTQVNKALFAQGNSFQIQKVLELSAGRPEEELVSNLCLRAMKQAVYSPTCAGHFGLAEDEYLHFTSPIRRYPDLVVHRMLKAHLEKRRVGKLSPAQKKAVSQEVSQLSWLAEHSSKMERLAEKVARESHEYLLVEYMQQFVGQRFSATISGVASYGLYVRLDNTAEGLLPLKELGQEYFMFDGVRHQLIGEESGTVYRLAQRIAVVLSSANPLTRNLSFKLCSPR